MSDPILIKKYPNRRLYHTGERRYMNLEDIERLVRQDLDFKVVDAETGEDLTRRILAQVVLEQMKDNDPLLPTEFLRFLIQQRGTVATWQDVVKRFGVLGAPAAWTDVLGMFVPRPAAPPRPAPEAPPPADPAPTEDARELNDELSLLRKRLDALENRVSGKPRGRKAR
jgi:polyhydroxyalkanoate synthesis repressor PhaR